MQNKQELTKILEEKEYGRVKRKYIKERITNDNLYNTLNAKQKKVIARYYSIYTTELFKKIRGSLRLEVTPSKAKELAKLKGEGMWVFSGMEDKYERGAGQCEMGHKLRYCYYAKNVQNGAELVFGSTCVGDFFDLDREGVKALNRLKEDMLKDIKEMVAVKEMGLLRENVKYDIGIVGRMLETVGVVGLKKIGGVYQLEALLEFIDVGLPIPGTMVAELEECKEIIRQKLEPSVLGVETELITELGQSDITLISRVVQAGYTKLVHGIIEGKETLTETERVVNKVFGTYTIRGLREVLPKWRDIDAKMRVAQDYYAGKGVTTAWSQLYRESLHTEGVDANLQKAIAFMAMMVKNSRITSTYGGTNTFPYKVDGQDMRIVDMTEPSKHIDELRKKDNIKRIIHIDKGYKERSVRFNEEQRVLAEKIEYIKRALETEERDTQTVKITRSIVIDQGKDYNTMSAKQRGVVQKYYIEKTTEGRKQGEQRVYAIEDRLDIQEKMEYLEASKKTREQINDIIKNIREHGKVIPSQITAIEKEYTAQKQGRNQKYKLDEHADVKEKLERIKDELTQGRGLTISTIEKDIVEAVLKYKSFSDKQMKYIETAYTKVKGRVV